jgi:hypothetical protein
MSLSHAKLLTVVRNEEHAIEANWAKAVRSLPIKEVACEGEVCSDTVQAWRQETRAPSLAKAVRVARRVHRLRAAILESLGVEMPEKNRVIAPLLSHLAAIAAGADELSAKRARRALTEFADATAMPLDGGQW